MLLVLGMLEMVCSFVACVAGTTTAHACCRRLLALPLLPPAVAADASNFDSTPIACGCAGSAASESVQGGNLSSVSS